VKPKTALIIGAACALLFGAMLLTTPDAVLRGLGLDPHGDGILAARDMSVLVLGLAVLNWLGRDAEGRALRAMLIANLVVHGGGFALHATDVVTHQLPGAAWPSLAAQAALTTIFTLALLATRARNRRRGDNVIRAARTPMPREGTRDAGSRGPEYSHNELEQ
jgi:hypothetical protein